MPEKSNVKISAGTAQATRNADQPESFRLMYAVRMNRKARSRRGGAGLSIRERAYLHIRQLQVSGKLEAGSSEGPLTNHR